MATIKSGSTTDQMFVDTHNSAKVTLADSSGNAVTPLPAGGTVILGAGSAVIGHVVNDAGSAVIGHVVTDTGSVVLLQAGSAIIGKAGIDQTTPGTTNAVSLAQVGATTITSGAGAVTAGAQRVAVGQDITTIAGSAPGTAGTASAQVVSVQGVASGTSLPVFMGATTDSYPAGGNITIQDTASVTVQGQFNQNQTTGTPTASSFVQFSVAGYTTMEFSVSGTWTGTVTVEGATAPAGVVSGTVWTNKTGRVPGSTLSTSVFTANGSSIIINIAGYTHVRVRATAAMTGTATVGAISLSANLHCFDLINPVKVVDGSGTTSTLTIKAANTAAGATDTSAVVAISPNSNTVVNAAGSAVIGKVGIDQTTPGTTNAMSLAQIGATTVLTGAGATAAGSQRTTVAQDATTIAGSAPGIAGTPSAQVISIQGVAGGTQIPTNDPGIPNALGQSNMAGSTSVTIASDQSAVPTTQTVVASATATETSVGGSASSVSLLASTAGRFGYSVFNDSTAILYLRESATAASTSAYTAQVAPGFFWTSTQDSFRYTGAIQGIWASATGNARITEYTA